MADEARQILDTLMGGDRNAPLPPGTAVPKSKKRNVIGDSNKPLLLPTKRSKSCYDRDVDPLYCAWGIDVYDLFVNTKSDLGVNPNTPDEGARKEYMALPKHEQERLGFDSVLFSKISDLVRQCDRTVTRNKEKLEQEIQRQLQKREGRDYVEDIDESAVDSLARLQLQRNFVEKEILKAFETMESNVEKECEMEENQENLKEKINNSRKVEKDAEKETQVKNEDGLDLAQDSKEKNNESTQNPSMVKLKNVEKNLENPLKKETEEENQHSAEGNSDSENTKSEKELTKFEVEEMTKELREITLKKQRSLFDLARKMQQYAPLQDSLEQQLKQLHFVKSDITMDKTVCDVSGNFMSARDADERIAAHYAGKQYVGWKLVRDKLKQMQHEYGRNGPLNMNRRRGGPYMDDNRRGNVYDDRRVGGSRPDDRYNRGNSGYNNGRGPPPRGNYTGANNGRDYNRSRDRDRERGGGYHGGNGYGVRGGGTRRDGRWGR